MGMASTGSAIEEFKLVDPTTPANKTKVNPDGSLNVNTTPSGIQEIRIRDGDGTNLADVRSDIDTFKRLTTDAFISNTTANPVPVSITTSASEIALWKARFQTSATDIALPISTDTTLLTITDEGAVNYVSINFDTVDVEMIIVLDGVEIFRVVMAHLGTPAEYDLDTLEGNPSSIATSRAKTHFHWRSPQPVYFTTSFVLKAKALAANKKMLSYLVEWRDKA